MTSIIGNKSYIGSFLFIQGNIVVLGWLFFALATFATFAAFLVLDPNSDLLLSSCMAANVAISLWAIGQFYKKNLLLSPMALSFLSYGMIIFYSWGNLGARIDGEGGVGRNSGSLAYYPLAALLTTIGLIVFCFVIFSFLNRSWKEGITYQKLHWKPWQAPACALLSSGILYYLSINYNFNVGYFRNVTTYYDQWLMGGQYFLLNLTYVISVSVILQSTIKIDKIIGVTSLCIIFIVFIGLCLRTQMIQGIILATVCWIVLRPHKIVAIMLVSIICILITYGMGSLVKGSSESSIASNINIVKSANLNTYVHKGKFSFETDYQYRMGGLEFPAIILKCLHDGAQPMYGGGIYGAMLQSLPNFLRPKGIYSERGVIGEHFSPWSLKYDDSMGVGLTSGLADWDIAGTAIYAIMAIYCLLLWRLMAISHYFFLGYLMNPLNFSDVFWDSGLFLIRALGFAMIILWLLGPILLPRVVSNVSESSVTRRFRICNPEVKN